MWLSNFLCGGIVLYLGCAYRSHDAYDGLSGFSTMSEAEKKNWDIIGAGRFITLLMMIGGAALVLGGVLYMAGFYPYYSMFGSWGIMLAVLLGGVFYIKASGRFKRK
jgi:hypothetical protein